MATGLRRTAIELALSKKVLVNTFSVNSPMPFFRMPSETFSINAPPCSDVRSGEIWAQRYAKRYFLLGGNRDARQGREIRSSNSSQQRVCFQSMWLYQSTSSICTCVLMLPSIPFPNYTAFSVELNVSSASSSRSTNCLRYLQSASR